MAIVTYVPRSATTTLIETTSSLCGHHVSRVTRVVSYAHARELKSWLENHLCPDCADVARRCQSMLDADGIDVRIPGI